MADLPNADLWAEIEQILTAHGGHRKYTGRITLHCNEGNVLKIETNAIFRARDSAAAGRVELSETTRG